MSKLLSIRLDDDTARALEARARATSRPKGAIVKEALRAHLEADAPAAGSPLLKYAGIMRGPRDLSTNKKHLASFGRRRRP